VGLFVLIGKAPFIELAQNFINTKSKIERFIARHPRPYIAKIYRPSLKSNIEQSNKPGNIVMWTSFKEKQ